MRLKFAMCGSNIQRMLSCPNPSRLPLVTVTFLRGLTHTCNYLEARNRLRHPILVHHLEQLMSIITQCPPQSSVSSEASFKATPSSASGSSSKASSSTSTAPAISNSLVKATACPGWAWREEDTCSHLEISSKEHLLSKRHVLEKLHFAPHSYHSHTCQVT